MHQYAHLIASHAVPRVVIPRGVLIKTIIKVHRHPPFSETRTGVEMTPCPLFLPLQNSFCLTLFLPPSIVAWGDYLGWFIITCNTSKPGKLSMSDNCQQWRVMAGKWIYLFEHIHLFCFLQAKCTQFPYSSGSQMTSSFVRVESLAPILRTDITSDMYSINLW